MIAEQEVIDVDMIHAAMTGDFDEVAKQLLRGARPEARDSFAVYVATENGHTEIVRLLLDASDKHTAAAIRKCIGIGMYLGHDDIVHDLNDALVGIESPGGLGWSSAEE